MKQKRYLHKPIEEKPDITCQETKQLTISDSKQSDESNKWDDTTKSHQSFKKDPLIKIPKELAFHMKMKGKFKTEKDFLHWRFSSNQSHDK